jgi:hypothetical protein
MAVTLALTSGVLLYKERHKFQQEKGKAEIIGLQTDHDLFWNSDRKPLGKLAWTDWLFQLGKRGARRVNFFLNVSKKSSRLKKALRLQHNSIPPELRSCRRCCSLAKLIIASMKCSNLCSSNLYSLAYNTTT